MQNPEVDATSASAQTHDAVVVYRGDTCRSPRSHERAMQDEVAKALAAIKGCAFAGEYDASHRDARRLYLVPIDTLIGLDAARRLGVGGEHDLFGGIAPFAFVPTKTITHPLVRVDSPAPEGWSSEFGERVLDVVLPGFSAFAPDDARAAGVQLLREGGVRVKKASGIGGLGQSVAIDVQQLEAAIESVSNEEWRDGVVLERNLSEVATLSVGRVRVSGLQASYIGRQRLIRSNHGDEVYGGSTLTIVRGGFDELLQMTETPQIRTAVLQARAYHEAAMQSFAGLVVSRANYDIAQGFDGAQRWCSGVLEQSWRIGGASCAEAAALQAFAADASLDTIRASTTEIYGPDPDVPPGARVYYSGVDEHVGMITKYSQLEPHANA